MNSSDDRRRGRTVTACSECQRRKQKCDRHWPCNHCQTRNSAHLCQFRNPNPNLNPDTNGRSGDEGAGRIDNQTSKKRKHYEAGVSTTESEPQDVESPDVGNALRALGYVESDMFRAFSADNGRQPMEHSPAQLPGAIHEALRAISPRPYTDDLVQNFFDNVNYHYNILHQSSFLTLYTNWWSQKRQLQSPGIHTIVFTCLVLRVCANSTQFLPVPLLSRLESELGDSAEGLSVHYQRAAQTLSNYVSPGVGGLMHVQQLFLGATWLKSEAEFVKSWHALGAAVREGQEVGIHRDDTAVEIGEFEREMRKRVWCGLYTWDRFMSSLFNRPSIIQDKSPIPLPNPRLDLPARNADIPSPIVAKIFECQLAMQLSELLAINYATPGQSNLSTMLTSVENWMASLPPAFSIHDSDNRWDAEYPRLVFQRCQLHCAGYMTLLMLLKPYLAPPSPSIQATRNNEEDTETARLTAYAIDTGLNLMSACKDFFTVSFPDKVKYYMVSFCPFDTAALLCSVLLHDKERAIPRRLEVVEAIGKALYISHRLRGLTKMGQTTWGILVKLVSHLELQPAEKKMLDEAGRYGELTQITELPVINNSTDNMRDPAGEPGFDSAPFVIHAEPTGINRTLAEGEMDDAFAIHDFTPDMELGVLDGVWDWESLFFDSFRNI